MDLLTQHFQHQFAGFLMVFVRTGAILFFAPVFGSETVPARVKIPLALVLAVILFSSLGFPAVRSIPNGWALATGGELLIGIAVGLVGRLLVTGVQSGGEIAGMQMGFGIVNVIDPMSGESVSIVGQFYFFLAMLVFLAIDGHHEIVRALARSFDLVPPGQAAGGPVTTDSLITLSNMVFTVAVRVAAPVIAALLLVSVTEAVIARTIPQINFMITGFAFRIAVGIVMVLVSLTFYVGMVTGMFDELPRQIMTTIRTFVRA